MNQRQRDFWAGVEAAVVVAEKHRSYFRSLDAARVVANEIRALEPPAEMAQPGQDGSRNDLKSYLEAKI